MPAISILIIDSNSTFSKAAKFYLSHRPEIEAVETTTDAQNALQVAGRLKPGMILIDVKLLITDGICLKLCEKLKQQAPGAVIMVLTLFEDSLQYSGFPEIDLISGFISKEYFADTLIPLISSYYQVENKKSLVRAEEGQEALN